MAWCFKHKNLRLGLTSSVRNVTAEAILQLLYSHPDVLDPGLTHCHQPHANSGHNPNTRGSCRRCGLGQVCAQDRPQDQGPHSWGTNSSFPTSPECRPTIPTVDRIIRGGFQVNKQSIFPGQVLKTSLTGCQDTSSEKI